MKYQLALASAVMLLAAACAQDPAADGSADGAAYEPYVTDEVLAEMRASLEFNAVVDMLATQGKAPVLDEATLAIHDVGDGEEMTGGFTVTVPVTDTSMEYLAERVVILFERLADGATTVSLQQEADLGPSLCQPYPDCVEDFPPSLPSCGFFTSADTCRPAASTWTGNYCSTGAKLHQANRYERRYYSNGRKTSYLDKVYSCGSMAAHSSCSSTCQ